MNGLKDVKNMDNKPNPNGANQTTSDPREQVCWDFYVDSIRENRENAFESAIKAGYEESSAKNITLRGWFKERLEDLERKNMLSKAEKKLSKTLTYEVENDKGEVKTDLLRIQVDVSKHLTETLGKNKGYSKRNELTGIDGEKVIFERIYYDRSKEENSI